ncbi:endospore germination permease [Alkalihalobacillus trypoxylicola]|uniref:Uncharacterized protein n=1 Tax=Alkalihalobacillus trypoxylicola TaxID=519424 RepID=A0A162F504_9BACI|nr:endospore germination permease [Alkalihalobacillus trypoxylicola]KYG34810.1 hypothetical protein AZF04_00295 [Alkalihalobacillus trypoxylicola]
MIAVDKISISQTFLILLLSIGLVNHVTIIPLLLQFSNKDSWIAVLLALPFCILWAWLLALLMKKTNSLHFLSWLEQRTGKYVSYPLAIIFITIFFVNGFTTLKEVIEWTKLTYLVNTPKIVTTLTLIIIIFYLLNKGIRTIAIVSGILLPFVILFGFFVTMANLQFKDYGLLQPFFTTSYSDISKTLLYILSTTFETFSILLIQHRLTKRMKTQHFSLLNFFLIGLTLGPLMASIALFGLHSIDMRYPAYEQWLLVRIGDYISNVDFLSIYQWLSGAFIRTTFSVYLIIELTQYLFQTKKKLVILKGTVLISFLLMIVTPVLSFINIIDFYKVYFKVLFYIYVAVMIISFFIILTVSKKEGRMIENKISKQG